MLSLVAAVEGILERLGLLKQLVPLGTKKNVGLHIGHSLERNKGFFRRGFEANPMQLRKRGALADVTDLASLRL